MCGCELKNCQFCCGFCGGIFALGIVLFTIFGIFLATDFIPADNYAFFVAKDDATRKSASNNLFLSAGIYAVCTILFFFLMYLGHKRELEDKAAAAAESMRAEDERYNRLH
ncbi:hypothetical protein ADUPG1_010378 [Aduncisulcus paluster]|uniref:Uncharacterized protein n=1 Tax=Aduncisulcus paluster TaxID=2918883 RepID=A0ABQ5JVC5_9EUKA|nr:hypothetical protein ADUPG1_010378 [Aduncisulcus paluster]